MGKKYVIIGGVACGPKTASRLRRLDPEAEITIIEKGEILSYGGCGMPYYLSGEVHDIKELWSTPIGVPRDGQFFKKVKNIDILDRTIAESIDKDKKVVNVLNLVSHEKKEISYDKLILAVGGSPKLPPLEGMDLNNVFKLNHPYDAEGIKRAVDGGGIKNAVIIGAGLIGLEVTEALIKQGIKVSVIEMMDRVLPKLLDKEMANLLENHMKAKGVDLYTNTKIEKCLGDDKGNVSKVLTDKGEVPADLILCSIGVTANTKLAEDAGLKINKNKAIDVNKYLQTSDENIYAGGDCVDNFSITLGKRIYTPLGDIANIHGRIIANNIVRDNEEAFPGVVGTAVCKVFDFNVSSAGLIEEFAGNNALSILSPGPDKAHFYPSAATIFIKLVADKNTRKILGAQIVGPGDVAKRIDMVSIALYKGMTVDEFSSLDLAYAPPFSPAIDNIITAANIMRNKLDGLAKSVTPFYVKEKLDKNEDFILLDVRSPGEIEAMSLPYKNVICIALGALREKISELAKDKEIITFCKISLRGYEAQRILEENGFTDVKFMDGGIVVWPFEKNVK